jgi:NifB/MoaA-like Fe-S oxidoreductase
VDKASAQKVIAVVEKWQKKLLAERGTRYVFAADELYLKAEKEIPPYEAYEDFSQIENGIGLIAAFKHDFEFALDKYDGESAGEISIATGESAYPLICECAKKTQEKLGGKIRVYKIRNDFFGESVTVAGLIVGRDIAAQLKGKPLGHALILPRVMLRETCDVFLDGMTLSELERELGVKIKVIQPDGESFVKEIIGVKQNG